MNYKNEPSPKGSKQITDFRLSGDKVLLGFFACLSLAFVFFYTFSQNTTHAEASQVTTNQQIAQNPISTGDLSDSTNTDSAVSDVVTKALAFKASLTTAQQATLEKTYTTTLARRWSNLPCGSNCRNGIQFSTLTSAQLALALQVIQAAAGTATNEGYDEFNQIRAADAYLNANGGGSGYGSGIYFIAFLNTPSTTGGWMLQFGGHHYGANIAFNQGHFVGATPQFEGVEPTTFTVSGTTYGPLEQERAALRNMLASLTTAQLATAKLSQTFSDVTLAPGESNGGSGTFPATKVGIAGSALTDAQKLLVLEAMKPWVKDLDDTVATNLLAIYQNELNGTYISYTGNGTSGSASSFLTANTNYARIDGPTVWIEFVCQNGVVFPSQIHYHSVFRDHVRDYGADLSLTTPLDTTTSTSAATQFDYDGDAKADLSVFRPSAGAWYLNRSTAGFSSVNFGISTDEIVPADYDGDGKTDVAVFRSGNWYILRSSDSAFSAVSFGVAGDVPTPGDYDGDGKADQAVFRSGNWYLNRSTAGFFAVSFGLSTDKPVAADYDGDGKTDVTVYRDGNWYSLRSSDGAFSAVAFGVSSDIPVAADYDGDGKDDQAVFRGGNWYLNRSTAGFSSVAFGVSTDTPTPADYDGDGKADVGVFRDGNWYLQQSTAGFSAQSFGISGDLPTPSAFIP